MAREIETSPSDTPSSPWLAIGLSVGVYLLTIAVCLGLVARPALYWWLRGRPHGTLTIGCITAAFVVARAAWPTTTVSHAPGVAIDRASHPKLLALLERSNVKSVNTSLARSRERTSNEDMR